MPRSRHWSRTCADSRPASRSWRGRSPRPSELWRWCLRNRAVASLIGTAASFLLFALAVSATAAVTIYQKNQTLRNTNVALAKAKNLAETKQKVAEDAARAANAQNKNAVETETEWINVMEHRLRYVAEVQDVREKMLSDATKNLDESIRAMTSLRLSSAGRPKTRRTTGGRSPAPAIGSASSICLATDSPRRSSSSA